MVRLTVRQSGEAVPNKVYIGTTHEPIQAAIDYAHSQGGGAIFIEHGTYLINNTANTGNASGYGKWGLKLYSNIKLTGEYFGTVLKPGFTNDNNAAVISCIGTEGNELENIVIEALLIGNDQEEQIGGIGIFTFYCGLAQTAGLSAGGFDSSTVGRDKQNRIGITIRNCVVQNNRFMGVYLVYTPNSSANENVFRNNNSVGVNLDHSSNSIVFGNFATNNSSYGIQLGYSSNNNVVGNITQNNASNGIGLLNSSNNNTITGNTTQNNAGSGVYIGASNNTITGNTSQNNNGDGIISHNSSTTATNSSITGNTAQHNGGCGIYLNNSSNNSVTGNIAQNNTSLNVYLTGSNYNTITGNIYGSITVGGTGNLNNASYNQQVS